MSSEHLSLEDLTPENVLPMSLTAQQFALTDENLIIDTAEGWKLRIYGDWTYQAPDGPISSSGGQDRRMVDRLQAHYRGTPLADFTVGRTLSFTVGGRVIHVPAVPGLVAWKITGPDLQQLTLLSDGKIEITLRNPQAGNRPSTGSSPALQLSRAQNAAVGAMSWAIVTIQLIVIGLLTAGIVAVGVVGVDGEEPLPITLIWLIVPLWLLYKTIKSWRRTSPDHQ
ncbi:hypothetical protein [Ruania alba]|uniref:Uncharacterized protein n=1 Tax=Ruania alba TaxID=648782 RepID=A0A1H5N7U4_9MICO|nr:hypothetical protein [Ruania alba]SEE96738.1 hypothetical protein SAMN04488554_3954 [Ruania alba]